MQLKASDKNMHPEQAWVEEPQYNQYILESFRLTVIGGDSYWLLLWSERWSWLMLHSHMPLPLYLHWVDWVEGWMLEDEYLRNSTVCCMEVTAKMLFRWMCSAFSSWMVIFFWTSGLFIITVRSWNLPVFGEDRAWSSPFRKDQKILSAHVIVGFVVSGLQAGKHLPNSHKWPQSGCQNLKRWPEVFGAACWQLTIWLPFKNKSPCNHSQDPIIWV